MTTTAPLRMRRVSLRFGGVQALSDVSLEVHSGEIVAIIGPNGAGKTSLLNVITGFYKATSGDAWIDEIEGSRLSPHAIARRGVARTFQTPRLMPEATCLGNLAPAVHRGGSRFRWGIGGGAAEIRARCSDALGRAGLGGREYDLAGTLTLGEQRRLELARACVINPLVLLLDEVASGLTETEAATIVPAIQRMAREQRSAVVVVEHSMTFIRKLAHRVIVLVKGGLVAAGDVEATLSDPVVVDSYLGAATDG